MHKFHGTTKRLYARYVRRDWFKSINDTYGHIAGDEVRQVLASKLKESLQEKDLACRYGGEEFILVITETTIEYAYERVELLRSNVQQIIRYMVKI
ncbi:MAG: GGDEF domain-containing protein [Psychrobacillus psychrodurans]